MLTGKESFGEFLKKGGGDYVVPNLLNFVCYIVSII